MTYSRSCKCKNLAMTTIIPMDTVQRMGRIKSTDQPCQPVPISHAAARMEITVISHKIPLGIFRFFFHAAYRLIQKETTPASTNIDQNKSGTKTRFAARQTITAMTDKNRKIRMIFRYIWSYICNLGNTFSSFSPRSFAPQRGQRSIFPRTCT